MKRAEAIRKARELGIPWAVILMALLEGLPVLLELIEEWLAREQP